MINTPIYEAHIASATQKVLAQGHRVLQIFRLAETERGHLEKLLELCAFPEGARVLDMGCGVGEVAKVFQDIRPDLSFVLLNNNAYQLGLCPEGFDKIYGDMHHTHFAAHSFDAVMLNYALGYARMPHLFHEIERILKPHGVLFIADLVGEREVARALLEYEVHEPEDVKEACPLKLDFVQRPVNGIVSKIDGLADAETIKMILASVSPVYYRFHKA